MKKILSLLSLLVMSATASAGGEVWDDSSWTNADASLTVTVGITQYSSSNTVGVKFTTGDHTSPEAAGTPGASSSEENPTATDSGASSTSSGTFRVKGGKVQKKNADGTWSDLKRKKKTGTQGGGFETLQVGEPAPSDGWLRSPLGRTVFLYQGAPAPFFGYFSPGEETTSLPL